LHHQLNVHDSQLKAEHSWRIPFSQRQCGSLL